MGNGFPVRHFLYAIYAYTRYRGIWGYSRNAASIAFRIGGDMIVTPAYGKDYKTSKEAREAWDRGADFIIQDIVHPACGKPCNKRDVPKGEEITIRYDKMQKLVVLSN
jgi:hypothetical protein